MRLLKKFLALALVIINVFICTSCWDYKDVEKYNIVIGCAVDKDNRDNQYVITLELIKPKPQEKELQSELSESKGSTILEAIRNAISKMGKKGYWAHTTMLIFSEKVISEDITTVMDLFYRGAEIRGDVLILISKEETAKEILQINHSIKEIRTDRLEYIVDNQKSSPKYPKTRLINIVANLASKDTAMLVPIVNIKKSDDKFEPEISGSAVLKYDKITGYLNGEETQYSLMVEDKLKSGLIVVQNIADTKNNITFEILDNKTKVKPVFSNGEITMKVDVDTTVNISELNGNLDFSKEDIEEMIKREGEKVIKARLESIIKKLQNEYKSDVFGFGKKVEIKNPKLWKKLKENWSEEFSSLPVEVNVDLNIKGSVLASKPMKGGK
ncbi:Ger(x)C family spore germination protein [Clostridium sp. SYSU_GA19001]|uniref:Ger(x)C family spore germination protein n=1 Tax=Clostridium caldaquaticum TaxID=2940653 RepID=UPI00207784DA|nr:Ger(x)C family spore germination protein [Clostridium caldaquaticum]MCM8709514.1 Ger(x)C family spore germination protein [Clostridium caldaquaticum]